MKQMLYKEFRLSASPLSYWFMAAVLLTFVPGYPILLGAFFITLGLFYSFQTMRENNDLGFSLLLPVAKAAVVKAKFYFVLIMESGGFVGMTGITLLRMAVFSDAPVYTANALMPANPAFLGFALLIFGLYNFVFVRGFFKTAYYFSKPFVVYIVLTLAVIAVAETLPHIPGLEPLGALGFTASFLPWAVLIVGAAAFILLTVTAVRASVRSFERIDL